MPDSISALESHYSFAAVTKTSKWVPNDARSWTNPRVSFVVLVKQQSTITGVRQTLSSILAQSYEDIEIIVVNDSKNQALTQTIRAFMSSHANINSIIHNKPLAVDGYSMTEGILRSRGDCVIMVPNCTQFSRNAVQLMLSQQLATGSDLIFSPVAQTVEGTGRRTVLPCPPEAMLTPQMLNSASLIPAPGTMIRRTVFDRVGLPDPHVHMGALYLWDFWRRSFFHCTHSQVCDTLATEHLTKAEKDVEDVGPWTYLSTELLGRPRNDKLLPSVIRQYDVCSPWPDSADAEWADAVQTAEQFIGRWSKAAPPAKHWEGSRTEQPNVSTPHKKIVLVSTYDPSSSLVFDGLDEDLRRSTTIIGFMADKRQLIATLIDASLVIIVRVLHPNTTTDTVINVCRALDIPLYYMLDDNFILLGAERRDLGWYTRDNMQQRLSHFNGMITTSTPLAEFMTTSCVHDNIIIWRPTYDRHLAPQMNAPTETSSSDKVTIGFFGGYFRQQSFLDQVVPVLLDINRRRPVQVVARGDSPIIVPGLNVKTLPLQHFFRSFVQTWRGAGCNLIIHPPGATSNIDYKTANAVLCAHYIGGLPIVGDEPAYNHLSDADGVLIVDNVNSSWASCINRALNPQMQLALTKRLKAHCERYFDPEPIDSSLRSMLDEAPACNARTRELRWYKVVRQFLH